jgi:hypothetical protein
MAVLSLGKDAESTDLETHVVLCNQRRATIESRLEHLEAKLASADERNDKIRIMVLGGFISLAVGVAGTIFAVLFKHGVV